MLRESKAGPAFSAVELEGIASLRSALLGSTCADPAIGGASRELLDDATLWRFLVARDWDVGAAKGMVEASLRFKREREVRGRLRREYDEQQQWWARMARRTFYGGSP